MVRTLKDLLGVPIVTSHVGAFPRPSWYTRAFKGKDVREMTMDVAWRESYSDALKIAIKEQELLGIDIVNDYCLRYDPYLPAWGWPAYVIERLDGVIMDPVRTRRSKHVGTPIMEDYNESIPGYAIVNRLGRGRLQFARFFSLAQQLTDRPIKFSVIDPLNLSRFMYDEYYKNTRELMYELARVYNEEFQDLSKAGCKIIQTDQFPLPRWVGVQPNPLFGPVNKEELKDQIDAFNESVKGIESQIWLHECWGRPRNQSLFGSAGSWAEGFRYLADMKADVIQIEAASTNGNNLEKELKAWKEYCPEKDVGIGVIDHRTTVVETAEEVAEIIRKALKYLPPEKLCVSTDCGLAALPRDIAFFKLKALSDGANLVRRELRH